MRLRLLSLICALLIPLSVLGGEGGAHTLVYTPIIASIHAASVNLSVGNIEQYMNDACLVRIVVENYAKRSPYDGDPTQGIFAANPSFAAPTAEVASLILHATDDKGRNVWFWFTLNSLSRLEAEGDSIRLESACWK